MLWKLFYANYQEKYLIKNREKCHENLATTYSCTVPHTFVKTSVTKSAVVIGQHHFSMMIVTIAIAMIEVIMNSVFHCHDTRHNIFLDNNCENKYDVCMYHQNGDHDHKDDADWQLAGAAAAATEMGVGRETFVPAIKLLTWTWCPRHLWSVAWLGLENVGNIQAQILKSN